MRSEAQQQRPVAHLHVAAALKVLAVQVLHVRAGLCLLAALVQPAECGILIDDGHFQSCLFNGFLQSLRIRFILRIVVFLLCAVPIDHHSVNASIFHQQTLVVQ